MKAVSCHSVGHVELNNTSREISKRKQRLLDTSISTERDGCRVEVKVYAIVRFNLRLLARISNAFRSTKKLRSHWVTLRDWLMLL